MATVFRAYGSYYDLLYKDKRYDQEVDYLAAKLQGAPRKITDILEFGSGTGRHAGLLTQRGFRVHGIERSAEMAAQSRQSESFTVQVGDIRQAEAGRRFDAVVSLFHVISYQTGNADLHAVFDNAARHLEPGGLFVFDFWYSPAVGANPPEVRVKRMSDDKVRVTRLCEPTIRPEENRVDVHYTMFVEDIASGEVAIFDEIHPMRHFSLPEIDLLCETHGFRRILAEEFLTGRAPGADSFGVFVMLEKL